MAHFRGKQLNADYSKGISLIWHDLLNRTEGKLCCLRRPAVGKCCIYVYVFWRNKYIVTSATVNVLLLYIASLFSSSCLVACSERRKREDCFEYLLGGVCIRKIHSNWSAWQQKLIGCRFQPDRELRGSWGDGGKGFHEAGMRNRPEKSWEENRPGYLYSMCLN